MLQIKEQQCFSPYKGFSSKGDFAAHASPPHLSPNKRIPQVADIA